MIEMNINKVLAELGVQAEVEHSDLSSAKGMKANIYVGTRDIASQLESLEGEVVSLNSMIDLAELKEKMRAVLIKMNLL